MRKVQGQQDLPQHLQWQHKDMRGSSGHPTAPAVATQGHAFL